MAEKSSELVAIEIDDDCISHLNEKAGDYPELNLIEGDILDVDLKDILGNKQYKVVSNLPYYISSPVVRKLIENKKLFKSIYVMLQKEVADRICAPEKSDRGFLSHFVNYYCKSKKLFDVPSGAFTPVPEVDSSFIRIHPLKETSSDVNDRDFFDFIKTVFRHRRKTLAKNLKLSNIHPAGEIRDVLAGLDLDSNLRAEDLTTSQLLSIFKAIQSEDNGTD